VEKTEAQETTIGKIKISIKEKDNLFFIQYFRQIFSKIFVFGQVPCTVESERTAQAKAFAHFSSFYVYLALRRVNFFIYTLRVHFWAPYRV